MSDTTTLYEKCVHNELLIHEYEAEVEGEWEILVCPGGRERTFEFLEECCTRCGNECNDHSIGVWIEVNR